MMAEQSNALPDLGGLSPEMLAGQDPVSFAKTKAAADIFAKKEAAAKSERAGRAESELYKSYGSALTQPYETFKPTPESGSGFMALGTLMLVAGSMMGGKGKMAGIGAMNNIAGMMDGYKAGRKDLYEQERSMFEENLKTQEKNRALIKEAFDQALKVAKYDLTGAKNMLEQRLTALGADIPKQMVQKNGVIAAASVMQQADVNHDKMMSTVKSKLTPREMIAIEEAGRKAKADAEKEAIGEVRDAKYGELGGVVGSYTPRQIYEAAQKGQTFVPKTAPSAGSTELKEYTWKENGEIRRGPLTPSEAIAKRDTKGVTDFNLAPTGKAAGDAYGFNDIVTTAANEAAASINNMVSLPATVNTGLFGGRQTVNLLTAPLDALTNTLTSEDVQRYNIEITNFGKFVAQLQKGGRAVTNYDIQASADAFKIKMGDTPLTVLTRLAQMRQAAERAIEVKIASPKTDENLKKILRQNEEDIKNAIPFTVNEVNQYALKESGDVPFSDVIKEFMKQSKQSKSKDDTAGSDDWSVEEVQ